MVLHMSNFTGQVLPEKENTGLIPDMIAVFTYGFRQPEQKLMSLSYMSKD